MSIGTLVKPLRYEARSNEQYLIELKRLNPENFGDYIYDVDIRSMRILDVNFNLNYSYLGVNATVYMRMPEKILISDKRVAKELGVPKNTVVTGTIDTSVSLNFVVAIDIPARSNTKKIGDTFDFQGVFAHAQPEPSSRGWDGKFIYENVELPIELLVERLPGYSGPDFTRGHAQRGYIDPGAFFTLDFTATFERYIRMQ